MDSNAEAGPSKQPAGPAAPAPAPSTPPAAKARRRSWFGFGSPATVTSSSSPGKVKSAPRKDELPTSDEIELRSTRPSLEQSQALAESTGSNGAAVGEELLTIDGDPELTVKKKKKRRSQGEEEGEALRMADLSNSPSRRSSETSARRLPHDPGGSVVQQTTPFTPRTFSRTASGRDNLPAIPLPTSSRPPDGSDSTPRPGTHAALSAAPGINVRTSSMFHSTSPTIPIIFTDKPQPLLPTTDRPLPALPPDEANPGVPRGIVVTPSSPRKLKKAPRSASASAEHLGRREDRRSASASGSGSRSSSATRRAPPSARSSPIGLGLPHDLVRRPSSPSDGENGDSDRPPPVPAKMQAVSSPLPSRSGSPVPRIAFAEPESMRSRSAAADGSTEPISEKASGSDEKKTRVKRARSLSGVFGKAKPVVVSSSSAKNSPNPPATPELEDPKEELAPVSTEPTKSRGVLEWLGMKKSVKRRQSEGKLRAMADVELQESESGRPPVPSAPSRESLRLQRPIRPDIRTDSSGITIMPLPGQRRSSSRDGRPSTDSTQAIPAPSEARPIPIAGHRLSAASSRSSLNLPRPDSAASPSFPQTAPWTSTPTPTSETEEMLFSPGVSANWGPGIRPWMDGPVHPSPSSSSKSSPLSALPEHTSLGQPLPPPTPKAVLQGNRLRSRSDAPRPPPVDTRSTQPTNASNPHLPPPPESSPRLSQSLQPSPLTPSRPKMPDRSSSGNSAIMGRMRNVFAKTTSRGRSQSLLRQPSSDIDDFGVIRPSREDWQGGATMRPSTSSSSSELLSPRESTDNAAHSSLLGLQGSERQIFLNEPSERSPRTSMAAASISSLATASSRLSAGPTTGTTTSARARARASTISTGPTSYNYTYPAPPTPASPAMFPIAATPPRRRPSVIQRLSNSRLIGSSGTSSPRPSGGSLFPLPPRSSGGMSSPGVGDDGSSGMFSPGTSPRPSTGSMTAGSNAAAVKAAMNREEDETAEHWLDRVMGTVGREDIASVLAASGDDFHTEALKMYMARFDFTHNALDVALRQLLMHMSLPKETQQIDRVVEAFSRRYEECEPGLFASKDNTYVLAFSMMMLHTDAFNKHNRSKMTKADYVRNTRLDGVSPTVLETFYDNITFTPFVFVEDDADLHRAPGESASTPSTLGLSATTATSKTSGKVDVYDMIIRGMLGSLRVDVEHQIPADNPLSCLGTRPFLDTDGLHRAFTHARLLQIAPPAKRKNSAAGLLGSTPTKSSADQPGSGTDEIVLRITKVGLLSRKDDGAKSSKKWKSWSVVLTGSQLLFFKDPVWAMTLLEQIQRGGVEEKGGAEGEVLLPRMNGFKPDEVFPVKDCIAVYDRHHLRYPNTFRFVMPQHRQYLLQASDEYEMNEWIALINFASTYKTAGLRMRGASLGKDRASLAGAAAAASHRRDVEGQHAGKMRGKAFGEKPSRPTSAPEGMRDEEPPPQANMLDVTGANDLEVNGGEQLEEVFEEVKAELAAGRGTATRSARPMTAPNGSSDRANGSATVSGSRLHAIQTQVEQMETRLLAVKEQLRASLQLARNLAILTPFQRSTRDRLAQAVGPLAHKIRHDRLEVAKLEVWLTVLRKDAESERQDWARVRHVALQAAAKSLKGPAGVGEVVRGVNAEDAAERRGGRVTPVPKLSLTPSDAAVYASETEGEDDSRSFGMSPGELPITFRRNSEDDRPATTTLSRSSSVAFLLGAAGMGGETTAARAPVTSRSSSELLAPGDARRAESPSLGLASGAGTPMLFRLSDGEGEGEGDEQEDQGQEGRAGSTSEPEDLDREDASTAHGHGERGAVNPSGRPETSERDGGEAEIMRDGE